MDFLGDTVTIVRHFSGSGRMGKSARKILEGVDAGENRLFISSVSLVEILYLSEKNRIKVHLQKVVDLISQSANYDIVDLNPPIIILAETLKFREIFDRLIMATARYLGVPLISSDMAISRSGLIETIWE
jgi:PIN domain nuclease of toxin-antitoxin system